MGCELCWSASPVELMNTTRQRPWHVGQVLITSLKRETSERWRQPRSNSYVLLLLQSLVLGMQICRQEGASTAQCLLT